MKIAGVILAAGFSARMGREKLTLPSGSSTIIERVLEEAASSSMDDVCLVYRSREVGDTGRRYGVRIVYNEMTEEGMASSIVKGVSASGRADGYMIMLGDMPFVTREIIDGIIGRFNDAGDIVVPVCSGRDGHPVLIGGGYSDELLALGDDIGARPVLSSHADRIIRLECGNSVLTDIDTPEEYIRIGSEVNGYI